MLLLLSFKMIEKGLFFSGNNWKLRVKIYQNDQLIIHLKANLFCSQPFCIKIYLKRIGGAPIKNKKSVGEKSYFL